MLALTIIAVAVAALAANFASRLDPRPRIGLSVLIPVRQD
jgi:hypothetical protein